MIIAIPERDHDHLADALVRDLGFTRTHVDAPLRELLLALDPYVDSGVTLANMGPSPRLSSKLTQVGGNSDEGRWSRLLHPPRPGAAPDRTATEVRRLLEVLRVHGVGDWPEDVDKGDVVLIGADTDWDERNGCAVAIEGRFDSDRVDHWIAPAGVVGEQEAIVAYVKELRQPKPLVKGDNEYIDPPLPDRERTFLSALDPSRSDMVAHAEAETVRAHGPLPSSLPDPDVEIALSERETTENPVA